MPISVVIVEDNKEIRDGLAALIESAPGFTCAAVHGSAEDALAALKANPPDVLLLDIGLPGLSGIDCARTLKARFPGMQILMQTVYEDSDRIFASLEAGASGYILKNTEPESLLAAIRDIATGGAPMSSQIARKVVAAFHRESPAVGTTARLTERETEILSLLARGYRYKEIAAKLYISADTVRTHIHNIYEKLHVRSRTEAVVKFLEKKG